MRSGILSAVETIFENVDDIDDITLPNELAIGWNADSMTDGIFPTADPISSIILDTDEMIGDIKDEMVEGRDPIAERMFENNPGTCEIKEEMGEKRELTPEVTSPTIVDATPLINPSISPTMFVIPFTSVNDDAITLANSSSIITFSSVILNQVKSNSLYYIRIYYRFSITRVASVIHWFRVS